jgi:hypothetical protein
MSRARALHVGLAAVTLTCGLSRPAHAADIMGTFIAGQEAGLRAREHEAAIELLRLQGNALTLYYAEQLRNLGDRNHLLELQAEQLAAATRAAQAASMFFSPQVDADPRAEAETRQILLAFSLRRPDWREYESAMLEYAQRLPPGQLTVPDYLDALYLLARRDAADATITQVAEAHTKELLDAFTVAYPDWHLYEQRMLDVMKTIPQPPGLTEYQYLSVLYRAARGTP